jgi:hypothetical protein
MFFPLFLLNEMACFVKNGVVSCIVHKKKSQNGVVLNSTADFLLPLDVQRNRGRKLRSPVFSLPFFLLLVQKDADQGPLLT